MQERVELSHRYDNPQLAQQAAEKKVAMPIRIESFEC